MGDAPEKTGLGLSQDVAGVLCYAFGWLSGAALLLLEKKDDLTRFHAAQSIVVFLPVNVLMVAISVGLWLIPGEATVLRFFTWAIAAALSFGLALLWITLMRRAWKLDPWRLPLAGSLAARLAGIPEDAEGAAS